MLVALIQGPDLSASKEQMIEALPFAEAYEFRIDQMEFSSIFELLKESQLPLIFTIRKKEDGGAFSLPEKERFDLFRDLAKLCPDFIDLEWNVPESFVREVKAISPKTEIITSYHNFKTTPDLDLLFQKMKKPFETIYKIACFAENTVMMLKMMEFVQRVSKEHQITGISLGEYGIPSRVLGKVMGNKIDYAFVKENELFQIPLKDLYDIYHYQNLHSGTKIYALIGDPVGKSPGHHFHNHFFHAHHINAVYVKCRVKKEDLKGFFEVARILPFQGLSVTMPLKEEILPFLDEADLKVKKIGACNTLFFQNGKILGTNTDGDGTMDLVEKRRSIRDKRILIFGAGGAAKAIAFAAKQRGAEVVVLNRDEKKAVNLARELDVEGYGLSSEDVMRMDYDVLINATSVEDKLLFQEKNLQKNALILDINHNPNTVFLKKAREKGCKTLLGYEMFVEQAYLQHQFWGNLIK